MIVLIGLGTLGSRVAKQLRTAEPVLLVDHDTVEHENVPGQYPAECVGMRKVDAARDLWLPRARTSHKHIDVTTIDLLEGASVVIDCTDNILVRRIINDYCSREGIPWIHTAMSDTLGTVASFVPGGACFNCLYPAGIGETCTREFNRDVAELTARTAVQELEHVFDAKRSRFLRIGDGTTTFDLETNHDCATHSGKFNYLELPANAFYITYCTQAGCMAAKPLKHGHEHGEPKEEIIHGIPVSVFPNGEIHFHAAADDDVLQKTAEEIYAR